MNIDDKVQSRLNAGRGVRTIIAFNILFGDQYVDVLFKDGNTFYL